MNGIDEQFFGKLAELYFTKETYDAYIKSNIRNTYEWITKEGIHIKLCLITDSHLNNIIKTVEKRRNEYQTLLRILKLERNYRQNYNNIVNTINEYTEIANIVF